MSDIALQRRLSDVVAEYEQKAAAIPAAFAAFNAAGRDLQFAATVGGSFGGRTIDTGRACEAAMRDSLLRSAWRHVYTGLKIEILASPKDKRRFEMAMEKPAPFTLENISATFGHFVADPRAAILRALAEVFCDLDPAYRSHEKMKVGVAGLPKRIIIGRVDDYGSYGKDTIESVLNALAAYQGKPLVTWREIRALLDDENALLVDRELPGDRTWDEPVKIVGRGVRLRRFRNMNGHLYFEPGALRDINRALAEFYGDVLPDAAEDRPTRARPGMAVSRDLQYYPTPLKIVDDVLADVHPIKGRRFLEPSCGCGRFMDGLRSRGADVVGIEYDATRAAQARAKGHAVHVANFLETTPTGDFDGVVMNPPFYGKHYAKHVEHALKFLKPGGRLTAILPSSARYDHGLLSGSWSDLPVGSFAESGTNINTSVLTKKRGENA